MQYIPSINVIQYFTGRCICMFMAQILFHPFDQMVLECTFDDLMQKVWHNQLVDVSTGKIVCERHKFPDNTILVPDFVKRKMLY